MVVLIDNTVLANFIDIEHFDVLGLIQKNTLFSKIIIPEAVKNEFANCPEDRLLKREKFLATLEITGPDFFELCTTYDPIILDFLQYQDKIHLGESEMIAQAQYRDIPAILTDDKACISFIKKHYSHIRLYNSCTLIAMLDVYDLILPNQYAPLIEACLAQFAFNRNQLKSAYQQAYEMLGISFDKRYVKARLYQDVKYLFS